MLSTREILLYRDFHVKRGIFSEVCYAEAALSEHSPDNVFAAEHSSRRDVVHLRLIVAAAFPADRADIGLCFGHAIHAILCHIIPLIQLIRAC